MKWQWRIINGVMTKPMKKTMMVTMKMKVMMMMILMKANGSNDDHYWRGRYWPVMTKPNEEMMTIVMTVMKKA